MSQEAINFFSLVILIPILGLIGYQLQHMQGHKKFRRSVLPIGQFLLSRGIGRFFAWALDPYQWQTDKRSLILLMVGLPVGILLLGGLAALLLYFTAP